MKEVPLSEKKYLTLNEASICFGIGKNRIRELSNARGCRFVLWVGNRRLIKRELFEKFLDESFSI